jgi:hypothetical protein
LIQLLAAPRLVYQRRREHKSIAPEVMEVFAASRLMIVQPINLKTLGLEPYVAANLPAR